MGGGVDAQEAYRGLTGRMAQEAMRRHVLRVLRVWRLWSVFSDDFLNGLQVLALSSPSLRSLAHPCHHHSG